MIFAGAIDAVPLPRRSWLAEQGEQSVIVKEALAIKVMEATGGIPRELNKLPTFSCQKLQIMN
jgi:hypothetical protein